MNPNSEIFSISSKGGVIQGVSRTLSLASNVKFEVVVGVGEMDPICRSIVEGDFAFSAAFELLFGLMKSGDRVLDLGAHVGTFALAAAAKGCQVAAIEASPYNTSLLQASVERNQFADRLKIIPVVISDQPGEVEFADVGGPYGRISNPLTRSPTIRVPAVTGTQILQQLGWDRVDFLKMDVEGAEVLVIQGMATLLTRADAPLILYESNGHTLRFFNQTPATLGAALQQLGYSSYRLEQEHLVQVDPQDLQPDCVVDYLASRQLPPTLAARVSCEKLTDAQIRDRVLEECRNPNPDHRAYIARALSPYPETFTQDPEVRQALAQLYVDWHPEVRKAAAWVAQQGWVPIQIVLQQTLKSWLRPLVTQIRAWLNR